MAAEDKYIEVFTEVATTATSITITSTYIPPAWILTTGYWDDSEDWVDDETWKDAP